MDAWGKYGNEMIPSPQQRQRREPASAQATRSGYYWVTCKSLHGLKWPYNQRQRIGPLVNIVSNLKDCDTVRFYGSANDRGLLDAKETAFFYVDWGVTLETAAKKKSREQSAVGP